ncbi:2458_t:CDS:10 [Rhizophagus irregularis]|nr:2458_t:CDS:10 [Rhizophagus irregularis]
MDRLKERHNPYPERKPLSNVNVIKCKGRGRGKSLRVPSGNIPFDRNPQFRGLQPPSPFWDETKTFEPPPAPNMFDLLINDTNVKINKNDPAFLEARLALERPCRTLFIRNIQYGTKTELVRSKFEEYGEIRDIFDIIEKRGMLFLSFYDIRAAEKAKVEMQNYEFGGRKIDVHYSLPKENEELIYCDRDKNQGTLFITLKEGKVPLDNDALISHFSQFGEVKIVREYRTHPNQRFVEFWDSRACIRAHDATLNAEYNGGYFDCKFAWDVSAKQRAGNIINRLSIRGNELAINRPTDVNKFERIPFHEHADENFINRPTEVEDFLNRLSPQLLTRDVNEYSPENGYNGAAFPSPQSSQNSSPPNQRVISQTQFAHMKAENKNMIDFGPLSETERLEQANKVQQMISMIAATQLAQSNGPLFPGLVGISQMHNHATFTPSINCNTVNPVLGNTVYNNNALGITPGVNPVVNPAFLNAIVQKQQIEANSALLQQQQQYVGTNQYTPYNNINNQQHVGFQYPLISQQQPFQQVTSYSNPYESLPTQQQPIQSQQQLTSFINHYVSSPQKGIRGFFSFLRGLNFM